jgi:NAD(P)-dependent dehydrogenase (short-subunit alcohol dehydrogenase family)
MIGEGALSDATANRQRRVVVVTGTSSGIGLAAAVAFARRGDQVVATLRASSRREGFDAAVGTAGGHVEELFLDVTDGDAARSAIASVLDRYRRIDVLVNNAGIGSIATLEELSIEDFRRSLEVNFFGVLHLTKAVLPAMRAAQHGHIIAVTSMGGAVGQPFNDAYCAAKFAVEGFYESLNPVAARFGVHVSIVEPGPVATEFRSHGLMGTDRADPELAELKRRYRAVTDAGFARAQSPEDAAAVIVAATDDNPPVLRYQTSNFIRRLVGRKLVDVTGEAVVGLTSPWLDGPGD